MPRMERSVVGRRSATRKANKPAMWKQKLMGCAIKAPLKRKSAHIDCYDVQNGNYYWEEDRQGSDIFFEGFSLFLSSVAFKLTCPLVV